MFLRIINCLFQESMREFFFRELYNGGLSGHFVMDKTKELVDEHYYWPRMNNGIVEYIAIFMECHKDKMEH